MFTRRSFLGTLGPDSFRPFLLLPDDTGGEAGGATGAGGDAPTDGETGATGTTTPPEDQKRTPEQELEHWKSMSRKNEQRAKEAQDKLKLAEPKLAEYDRQVESNRTEQEKAIEAAKAEALRAGATSVLPQILIAELRAASGGALDVERATAKAGWADKGAFFAADGTVDMAKVTEWAKDQAGGSGSTGGMPDLGQGSRGTKPVTGKEAAEAEAARRGWVTPAGAKSA